MGSQGFCQSKMAEIQPPDGDEHFFEVPDRGLLESNCRQTASPAPALVPRGGAGQSEAEGVRIIRAPSCDVIFMAGIGLSRERIVTERIKYEAY